MIEVDIVFTGLLELLSAAAGREAEEEDVTKRLATHAAGPGLRLVVQASGPGLGLASAGQGLVCSTPIGFFTTMIVREG